MKIIKRDGTEAQFNKTKIKQAIDSSKKTNEWGTYYADYLEGKRNQIEHKITSDNTSSTEKKAAQQQYASIANEGSLKAMAAFLPIF